MNYFNISLLLIILNFNPSDSKINISNAAEKTVKSFLESLENLDENSFKKLIKDDATWFLPYAAERANNLDEIMEGFKPVFSIKNNSSLKPPYLKLKPFAFKTQLIGDSVAVVTWMFNNENNTGRATAVLVKDNNNWLIISFHGSNINKNI